MTVMPHDVARASGRDASLLDVCPPARYIGVACIMVLLLTMSNVMAQDLRVGIRTGPTFGFLNDSAVPFVSAAGETKANTNVRVAFHAGAYGIIPVSDRFSLQPEILYLQKGAHFSRLEYGFSSERYRFSYLQVQLLGRRDISFSGPLSLHALGGLTVDRALNGIVRRDIQNEAFAFTERIDLMEQDLIRQWDVGGLVGIGIDYSTGSAGRFSLDVRYNFGVRSLFSQEERSEEERPTALNEPPPLTRTPPSLRHDVITASLSYTVSLSR